MVSGADSMPQPFAVVVRVGLNPPKVQDESVKPLIFSVDPDSIPVED